ncbi:collagen alpha-2(I) chain-like [Canis lupus dingo]|uniref:collagen alpha-2(I) chain-like n=1 Tax=Canis lupus dingo TaxID=286419 RepID=UPI0015F18865|nr:collagen alpha-2(I) chain-like [Canis lupus dingo]
MGQARGGFLTAGGPGLGHQQTQPAEGSDAIVLRMEVRSAPGGRNQTFVGGAQREAPCSFGAALRPRDGRPTCTRLRGASGQGSTPGTGGPGVPSENPQPREEAHKRAESGGWSEFEAARPCPPPSLPVLPGLRGLGPGREWAPLAGPAAERAALAHAFKDAKWKQSPGPTPRRCPGALGPGRGSCGRSSLLRGAAAAAARPVPRLPKRPRGWACSAVAVPRGYPFFASPKDLGDSSVSGFSVRELTPGGHGLAVLRASPAPDPLFIPAPFPPAVPRGPTWGPFPCTGATTGRVARGTQPRDLVFFSCLAAPACECAPPLGPHFGRWRPPPALASPRRPPSAGASNFTSVPRPVAGRSRPSACLAALGPAAPQSPDSPALGSRGLEKGGVQKPPCEAQGAGTAGWKDHSGRGLQTTRTKPDRRRNHLLPPPVPSSTRLLWPPLHHDPCSEFEDPELVKNWLTNALEVSCCNEVERQPGQL